MDYFRRIYVLRRLIHGKTPQHQRGFQIFPVSNPQILTVVILDEPKMPMHWGGTGAAVAFKRIAKRVINMDDTIKPPIKK